MAYLPRSLLCLVFSYGLETNLWWPMLKIGLIRRLNHYPLETLTVDQSEQSLCYHSPCCRSRPGTEFP